MQQRQQLMAEAPNFEAYQSPRVNSHLGHPLRSADPLIAHLWRDLLWSRDLHDHRLSLPTCHQRLVAQMTKEIFLHKRGAPIVQDLHVGFEAAIERHRDRPGPRKDVRVLDRDFILDGVLVNQRKAFDQTQRVTVEVAGAIKPRPGVEIPDYLKERYPGEMTIVLQHQFYDLEVDDKRFIVMLKFNNVPERLRIPLQSITIFTDPSVNFALQFQPLSEEDLDDDYESQELDIDDEDGDDGAKGEVISLDKFRAKSTDIKKGDNDADEASDDAKSDKKDDGKKDSKKDGEDKKSDKKSKDADAKESKGASKQDADKDKD